MADKKKKGFWKSLGEFFSSIWKALTNSKTEDGGPINPTPKP